MQLGYWQRLFNKGSGSRLGPTPQELDTHTSTCRPVLHTHTHLASSSADGNDDGDSYLFSFFFLFLREVESALLDTLKVFSNLFFCCVRLNLFLFFLKKKRGASGAIYIAAIYRKKVLTNTKSEPEQRHREDHDISFTLNRVYKRGSPKTI